MRGPQNDQFRLGQVRLGLKIVIICVEPCHVHIVLLLVFLRSVYYIQAILIRAIYIQSFYVVSFHVPSHHQLLEPIIFSIQLLGAWIRTQHLVRKRKERNPPWSNFFRSGQKISTFNFFSQGSFFVEKNEEDETSRFFLTSIFSLELSVNNFCRHSRNRFRSS